MPAIHVNKLTKVYRTYQKEAGFWGAFKGLAHRTYKETAAAKEVSFTVQEGELVGFLGPNGAGKTTTLKMLAGLLQPTSGEATVLGFNPSRRQNEFKRQFALVLGQKNQLWWDLPAAESLELNRVIYGLDPASAQRTIDELTELLDVREKLDVMVRELSLGERMKMELIAALLHRPKVLFLDEPTIGLDVVSQKKVREFLRDYTTRNRITTLLTSHYMQDIEELCDRVIIIDHGQVFFDGGAPGHHRPARHAQDHDPLAPQAPSGDRFYSLRRGAGKKRHRSPAKDSTQTNRGRKSRPDRRPGDR